MYTRPAQVWPILEKDLSILKEPLPGKREGQTSQEVHRSPLSVSTRQPIPCLTSLIMHTFPTTVEILHRERGKEAGFSPPSCLNNDVGAMNRGACNSPWTFGSWPVASLVRAPVSNDPCQRIPCIAVMTYHISSLRPHTDNYNHIYSFLLSDQTTIMTNWYGDERRGSRRRSWGVGTEKKRAWAGGYVQTQQQGMAEDT